MFSAPPTTPAFIRVDFVLTSDPTMFGVKHAYSARLIDIYKEFPKDERSFDPQTKEWRFPWPRYKALMERLAKVPGVSVGALPVTVSDQFTSVAKESPTSTSLVLSEPPSKTLPAKLWASLLPFQKQGVEYAVKHNGRILLADEMGLGKSIQALAVAAYYRSCWPLLIIAPKSVLSSWKGEVLKWLPDLPEEEVCVPVKGTDAVFGTVRILSYDLVTNFTARSVITPTMHGVVIADESHLLKSYTAKRTKAIVPLLKSAKHALCLSGTPALSRPAELYTQISALVPNVFGTFKQFSTRYCGGFESKFGGWQARGSTNADELKTLLERTLMIRRFKSDVLSSLPPKRRFVVKVPVKDAVKADKLRRAKDLLSQLDQSLRATANAEDRALIEVKRRALMAQLYRDTGVAKLPGVGDFLDKFLLPPVAATASVASTAIMSSSSRRGTVVVDSSDEDDVIPPSPARRGKRSAIVPSKVIKKRAFALMSDDEDEDEDEDEPKGSATRRAGGESVELQCLQCNGSLLAKTVSGLCEECDAAAFASVFTCQKAAPVASVPSTCAAGSGSDEVVVISDDVPDPVVTITSVKDSLPQGMQAASKIIMFGHHRDVLDGVEAEVRIDGGTTARQQQAYVQRFQNDPECQVAIVGITAAGTGITLTAASACVFVELYWNPGTLNQAEDRIHRIGQQAATVQMVYLLASDGIDDDIWQIVGRKIDVLAGSLEAQKSGFSTSVGRGGATKSTTRSVAAMLGVVPHRPVPQLPAACTASLPMPTAPHVIDVDDEFDAACAAALDVVEKKL